MGRGTPALIGWLTLATVALIAFFALIVTIFSLGPDGGSFVDRLFNALLHALDPGTVAGDEGRPWRFVLVMLALTIAGLFIVSALIGVIAAGIDAKLSDLRRGRSKVLESDHTVILGWSDSIFTIVRELTIANESRKRPVIVILADRDKVEMEEDLKVKIPDFRGTRVVCRSGSPMDLDDLALTSHLVARSVILLAPAGSDEPDSEVIKTLLALTYEHEAGPGIVAEIQDPKNLGAAQLVGGDRTCLLDIRETVAKLVVQTSRQSGAAAVYTELFDYEGDEIYFHEKHDLGKETYADAQLALESASVIGLVEDGVPTLNPAPDTVIGNRSLIVVAEDDGVLSSLTRSTAAVRRDVLGTETPQAEAPTKALIVGWNDRAPIVIKELESYAPPGSTLTVITTYAPKWLPPVTNLTLEVIVASTTERATLDQYVISGLDQVIVLCYSDHLDAQAADARTLVTLLHVRDILGGFDVFTPVVSEMLDDRNRVLAQVAHVDDVVVSGEIVSLLVTQLSEDRRLEAVFKQLLGQDGSEVYLRPAAWYVQPGNDVTFATIVAGAIARGETAIGLKSDALARPDVAGSGVVINPTKSTVFSISADDRVVVLAER